MPQNSLYKAIKTPKDQPLGLVQFEPFPFAQRPFYLPVDQHGRTKLHHVAMKGCTEDLHWYICSEKLDLDQVDFLGRTAIHYASNAGNVKITQILLAHGANPNIADLYGYTPMHYAAENGHVGIIYELVGGKGIVHQQNRWGMTPLHLSALNGHVAAEKLLLDNDANINQTDNSGGTALHFASIMGYLSIVKDLIARDAKINAITSNGKTPLNYADNFEEIKQLLLGHGAKLGHGVPDPADPIYLALPLPNKNYAVENQMLGEIYDYFNTL